MQDVQDPVTGALDRLALTIDRLAADAQDHRSQNAADLASLSMDLQAARGEVLERVAVLENDLTERIAVLELAARSAEAVQAASPPEPVPSEPAPPQLVEALHGPNLGIPTAVPLDIPGMGVLTGHIDSVPDADPDVTWGGVVRAFRRPVSLTGE